MSKTEYANIGKVAVERTSEKAVLIRRGQSTHWVPKSVLKEETAELVKVADAGDAKDIQEFEVAEWFAQKEEL